MSTPEHLIPVAKRILLLSVSQPPSPWQLSVQSGVGGLSHLGFGPDSDLLLVVSSQGRSLFDCATGERVARDDNDDGSYHNEIHLVADGIGPLEDCSVPLAGIHGGGLSRMKHDGWSVDDFTLVWPDHTLLLNGPFSWPYDVNVAISAHG